MAGWSIPIDKLAAKMELDLVTVARNSTKDVFTSVNYKSAVDTGRFRGNWNVSYGAPDLTVTDNTDASRAEREIAKVDTLPVGGIVYLCNSLPYARVLEYGLYPNPPKSPTGKTQGGYSKQTPQGMVRITALEFHDYVQKAISK
jgi:hypothetical protein